MQVVVNPKRPINQILAMIGHELQHAIEISEAPSVVDEATMAGLYRRIGVKSCGNRARACYETRGAQVTGATHRQPSPTSESGPCADGQPCRPDRQ